MCPIINISTLDGCGYYRDDDRSTDPTNNLQLVYYTLCYQ